MEMSVTELNAGHAVRICLTGRLDTMGVNKIESRFLAVAVAGGTDAVVDLSAVELITSMGIRMLISAVRSMSPRKRRLVLFGAQGIVHEVLETAAIDSLMAVVPTEVEALALIGG